MSTITRILLAEDSQTQAFTIKERLIDEGYEVEVAGDGQQALDAIPKFWPHLILTDMDMPIIGGLELVTRASAAYPAVPIVLITAKGSDKTAVEALERGAAAYLPKSLLEDKLFATIDEVLDVLEANSSYSKLIESVTYDEIRFELKNDAELVRPLVDLVTQMAAGMTICEDSESVRLGMAIEHAIRNAMLHGNLELTKEELESDGELVIEGEKTLVQRRAEEPKYRDRHVHVIVQLTPSEANITVRDEGPGFDLATVPAPSDADALAADQGRGLVLMQSLMDEVKFNETGNQVTLVKRR